EGDIRRMDDLRTRAHEILPEARRLADDIGLPAHLEGADFTLDGQRLTFSFTSEERIDYREFVRRAGDRFGARVDMRQLGARDRAKLAGGYGICGRELCCSSWLTTFPSISIRMAKDQELPLNPQKISGLCGRLLCCLSYEEAGYQEMRKTLPKLGQRCSTPTGEGKVISVNILRRQVTLVLPDGQRVDVGDKDLGLVVRWDTASKSGTPPPSLSRAEAIELGLLEDTGEVEEVIPEPVVDWITARPAPTEEPGPGRGRLPGGGPRKQGRPRPERAPGGAPGQPAQSPQPGQRQPANRAPQGDRRPSAPLPPPKGRPYQRAGQPPVSDSAPPPPPAPRADAPADPDAANRAQGARRRGRRGGRGRGPQPGGGTAPE
ncbi:MAG TPA: regulatory iron-sulfur-containing complex subunit RicT, partial [Tepidiformaceae bacterium]|nr:regulatory iron-sulfur-containing complex subunit RicT [Tepidiformaceae bacterium]